MLCRCKIRKWFNLNFWSCRFPANTEKWAKAFLPPHRPVLCRLGADLGPILFSLSPSCASICLLSPVARRDGAEQCLSVLVPYLTMHYDSPPLACPVLFCSTPVLFPFHWQCPSFPPLSPSLPFSLSLSLLLHSSDLSLPHWSRSDRGERRRRGWQECQTHFCADNSWTLSLCFCGLFGLSLRRPTVNDGRIWAQTPR